MFSAVVALLLIHACHSGRITREVGDKCTTPNSEAGECRNIKNCPALLEFVKQNLSLANATAYLRESNCGFEGMDSLVCCPDLSSRLTPWNDQRYRNRTTIPRTTRRPTVGSTSTGGQCGRSAIQVNRIVGGESASLGNWPWISALGYTSRTKPGIQWLCAGALVTNRHVITAGHCIVIPADKRLTVVRLGDLDLDDNKSDGASPVDMEVERTIPHSDYKSSAKVNDIAIVKLKGSVQFTDNIQPICLPGLQMRSAVLENAEPFVAGWGAVSFRGPATTMLQQVDLVIKGEESCRAAYSSQRNAVIDNRVICAGSPGKDACQGDSGGPLMLDQGALYYLVGVVSYGKNCADPNYPGVYTRVSTFMDWISRNLY